MPDIDYTSQLTAMNQTLSSIASNNNAIDSNVMAIRDAFNNLINGNTALEIPSLHDDIQSLLTGINGLQNTLVALGNASVNVDYSASLNDVCQLLSYTDLLLVVMIVFMLVGFGMFAGYQVTRWMKQH